ncbi:MAG: acyl-CoA/acyl-ACP dehydrogenase [Chloroflexi bacterium]|nr:acyl-CoA/acyl-ACP dehydrogenase [Chloroflexota bacterium]
MDFDFTDEQLMLQTMTRDLLAVESTPAKIRQLADSPEGYSAETWGKLAELGLLGVTIAEANGGQGLGAIEQALVLEEMGRAALPSPYFATAVLAAGILNDAGSEEQQRRYLAGIASGQVKGTLALLEEGLGWNLTSIHCEARPDGGGWRLNGVKWLVPYAHVADVIVVGARDAEGISLFAVDAGLPGVQIDALETMDLTNRVSRVTFKDVRVAANQVIGQPGEGEAVLRRVLNAAAVGASAEMLGASRKCLEMSVEYARTREQFGQPIGSFQAVKHKCSEMLVEVEQSHSATYYAAWAISADAEDADLAASVAKAYVSGAARKVCGDAIQVHGGIGFTWDYDLQLYFKRAKHMEPLYGDQDFHRERALQIALQQRPG